MRQIGTESMHYRWSLLRTEDRPSSTSRSLLLVHETQFETTPQVALLNSICHGNWNFCHTSKNKSTGCILRIGCLRPVNYQAMSEERSCY